MDYQIRKPYDVYGLPDGLRWLLAWGLALVIGSMAISLLLAALMCR